MWRESVIPFQTGSFVEPVVPPDAEACDQPRVCISISAAWLPYLCGAAMQLVNPSSWLVPDQATLDLTLARATDLISAIGTAMPCSTIPPTLAGHTTSGDACNIAGYISNMIIRTSMAQAISAIQAGQTVIGYGLQLIRLIPDVGLVFPFLIQALYDLYQTITGGSLADYQAAVNDDLQFGRITCAIYSAISAVGRVTDGNFATLRANVAAISWSHSDVQAAVLAYIDSVGAAGLQQLQVPGVLAAYDCSGCGSGTSSGPSSLPISQQAGIVSITIAAGNADATATVDFVPAWPSSPVIVIDCDSEALIASIITVDGTQFVARIAAAVNVTVNTTAVVHWQAQMAGAS